LIFPPEQHTRSQKKTYGAPTQCIFWIAFQRTNCDQRRKGQECKLFAHGKAAFDIQRLDFKPEETLGDKDDDWQMWRAS
jgi:hypothetical protein